MGRIRIYRETDCTGCDSLDELSTVINNADEIYDKEVNILTAIGRSSIKVKLDKGLANQADYVIIDGNDGERVGYYITGKDNRAGDTIEYFLEEDALTTIFPDIEVIYGSANRLHVNDDDTTYYTIVEPFVPSERLNVLGFFMDSRFGADGNSSCKNILETLVIPPKIFETQINPASPQTMPGKLSEAELLELRTNGITAYDPILLEYDMNQSSSGVTGVIDKQTGTLSQISVTHTPFPRFRKLVPTQLSLPQIGKDTSITLSTSSRWWFEEDIPALVADPSAHPELAKSSVINDLRSLGIESNITAYWSVPTPYIGGNSHKQYSALNETDWGGISAISASVLNNTYIFRSSGIIPKNNKAKYCQVMTLTVFSPISGSKIIKQPYEICNPDNKPTDDNINADYSISADLRADGAPIFAWKYSNGTQQVGYPETIEGGKWRRIPIGFEGMSGSYWGQRQLDVAPGPQWMTPGLVVGGAISGGTAGGLVGAGLGALGGLFTGLLKDLSASNKFSREIAEQQALLDAQGQVATADVQISASEYLREIGFNSFYSYWSYYSENDVAEFDKFLTMYGYKVGNKSFTIDDLTSRQHFNFIRANDVTIKTDKWGSYMVNKAIEQLKRGVRIWHELPNEAAILDGNPKNS